MNKATRIWGSLRSKSPLLLAFYGLLIFQIFMAMCIPLEHMMNDSGWYFMNVHFVETGEYINESRHPSFVVPSQLYPFFGYSLYLFVCSKIGGLIGIAATIKTGHIIMYAASAFLVVAIMNAITGKKHLSYALGIAFLAYHPYFNHVTYVMSETYAVFLILWIVYWFVKQMKSPTVRTGIVLFISMGCLLLVKPVVLPVIVVIGLLYSLQVLRTKNYRLFVAVFFVLLFPLCQMGFSKSHYGNYKLKTGGGWNLWDRLIKQDGIIPEGSVHLDELKKIYADNNRELKYGYWWDITKDLSEFGYSEVETMQICKDVAMDAVKQDPVGYFLRTWKNSYMSFTLPNGDAKRFTSVQQYFDDIEQFSHEPQHKPLTDMLMQQTGYNYGINESMIQLNAWVAKIVNKLAWLFHNGFVFVIFMLVGAHTIYQLFKSRFKEHNAEFLIWFFAFGVMFGSNMAEYIQPRFLLPSIVLMMMSIVLKLNALFFAKSQEKYTEV